MQAAKGKSPTAARKRMAQRSSWIERRTAMTTRVEAKARARAALRARKGRVGDLPSGRVGHQAREAKNPRTRAAGTAMERAMKA